MWGGIQGSYACTMTNAIPNGEPAVPTVLFFTGHSIVTLKSGDVVLGTDTDAIDLPPGQGGFASLITRGNDQRRLPRHDLHSLG